MQCTKRDKSHEFITLDLELHEPERVSATIITDTTMHAAGSQWIEGLKQVTVLLDERLPIDDVGIGGRVTRRDGDTWAVLVKNDNSLVRSGD